MEVTSLCFASWREGVLLVSGDASGRVVMSPLGAHGAPGTPQRLDKLSTPDAAAAACHKYHPVLTVEASVPEPSHVLVLTANGRLTVWDAHNGIAGSGPALLSALVLNFNVDDLAAPWLSLVPVGTTSEASVHACFSPCQSGVVVCALPQPVPAVLFYSYATRSVLREVRVEAPLQRLVPVWLGGLQDAELAFVASVSGAGLELLSPHADSLGAVAAAIQISALTPPLSGSPCVTAVFGGKSNVGNLITVHGAIINVWKVDC